MRPQRINKNAAKIAEAAYEVARLRFGDGRPSWALASAADRAHWLSAARVYYCAAMRFPVPETRTRKETDR